MTREQIAKDTIIELLKNYKENSSKLILRRKEKRSIDLRLSADKEAETSITTAYRT